MVKLTDFSNASRLPAIDEPGGVIGDIRSSMAYMSPEQTGRMNREVDYRSDFYSLGVLFYHLLTGTLPFNANDSLELAHCHIARRPVPPRQVNMTIPESLSLIVMKLLAKSPDDRYQSAHGIESDLRWCLEQVEDEGEIKPFALGRQDISERFTIPGKLYGRAKEKSVLNEAFDRASGGTLEIVLLSGRPGIGKTALVEEMSKPIAGRGGVFHQGQVRSART